jgi:hypothetical protein
LIGGATLVIFMFAPPQFASALGDSDASAFGT